MADEDWFSHNIPVWSVFLESFKGKPKLRFLEIGSYEGRSAEWLCDNVLTGEGSELHCVDTFEGGQEHTAAQTQGLFDRFQKRVFRHLECGRIAVIKGRSIEVLSALVASKCSGTYHFIYVDGSHTSRDVLGDAVLAWQLLAPGGGIVFDDYTWDAYQEADQNPRMAIDAFMACFTQECRVVLRTNQVWLQKRGEPKATPWFRKPEEQQEAA